MNNLSSSPIGILDSGIGGVSVAQAIMENLPNENILYVGDTYHMPYGQKTKEEIQKYTTDIIEYLIKRNAKLIIIACNTATAASQEVLSPYKNRIKIFNVIDPVVDYIIQNHAHHKVGLICTDLTYRLGMFEQKIESQGNDIRLISLRASKLASLIETEFDNTEKLENLITEYFYHHHFKDIDAVILGCTHYVWLKKQFLKLNPYIDWIEPTKLLVKSTLSYLTENNIVNNYNDKPEAIFCQSGNDKRFFDLIQKLTPTSHHKKYIDNLFDH